MQTRKSQQAAVSFSYQQQQKNRPATESVVVSRSSDAILPALSNNQSGSSPDYLSDLVDFELFDESMQSPHEQSSRNNLALTDLDAANLFLSQDDVLSDTHLVPHSSFHPVF